MKASSVLYRIILDVLIAALILAGYWPAALVISLIAAFVFADFIELILSGLLIDALVLDGHFYWMPFPFMIATTFAFFFAGRLRRASIRAPFL